MLVTQLRSWLTSIREKLFISLFRARFRYDVFISYSHRDSKEYAANLKKQLSSLDFSCFIDEEESPPGSSLDPTLAKALKKSAVLVLLATERALTRPYIITEFEKFASTQRTIVPINILGALTKNEESALARAPWNIINTRNLVWIDETDDAFAKKNPSPPIADGIDKLFKYTRRKVRVRAEIIGTAVIVLLAAFGAGFVIKGKNSELAEQNTRLAIARTQSEAAEKETTAQKAIAAKAQKDTVEQLRIAKQATDDAETAKKEASRQQTLANEAAAEANKQQLLAKSAELRTKQQLELNEKLSYDSDMNLAQRAYEADDIPRASQLMNAHVPTPDAKKDLRSFDWFYLWRLFNNEQKRLPGYKGPITFLPDSNLLALTGNDSTLKLLDVVNKEEKTALNAKEPVTSVMFSDDGRMMVTNNEEGVVKAWDLVAKPAKEVMAIKALTERPSSHQAPVKRKIFVTFSHDSKTMAVLNDDSVTLWDSVKQRQSGQVKLDGYSAESSIEFSPDNNILVVRQNEEMRFWDLRSLVPKELEMLRQETSTLATCAAIFSPDSKTLITEDRENSVRLWDLSTDTPKQRSLLEKSKWHLFGAFTPKGDRLLLVDYDGNVEVWETRGVNAWQPKVIPVDLGADANVYPSVTLARDGNTLAIDKGNGRVKIVSIKADSNDQPRGEIATLLFPDGPESFKFSPDSTSVAGLSVGGSLKVWSLDQQSDVLTPKALASSVSNFDFSPDGQILAAVDSDNILKLWDMKSTRMSPVNYFPQLYVTCDALAPDNSTLVMGDSKGQLWLLNAHSLQNPKLLKRPHGSPIFHLAFSPDGKVLIGGGITGSVQLWKLDQEKEDPRSLRVQGSAVTSIVFNFRGDRAAVSDDSGKVEIWDTNRLDKAATELKLASRVWVVAFSGNGNRLLIRDNEKNLNLWDANLKTKLRTLATNIQSLALSRDLQTVVTISSEGQVKLWDTATAEARKTVTLRSADFGVIALSPDGRILATSSADAVKLRDIDTGQELLTLKVRWDWHRFPINSLTFADDGKLLIARIGNGEFAIWYAAPRDEVIH